MREIHALVTVDGRYVGEVEPFPVEQPWWAQVADVTAHLDRVLGVPTSVLRLVSATGNTTRDGSVTYQVEAYGTPNPAALSRERTHEFPDTPLRLPWAKPGGPADLVAWADRHIRRTGPARQVKTWNLSCVYRLPTADGPVWAKEVPPFFAAEPTAVRLVAEVDPSLVPALLTDAPRRVLLADAPGDACWDATAAQIRSVVPRLVAVQAALAGRPDPVLPRIPLVTPLVPESADLAARLAATGLPETLMHGDFHPGNWLADGDTPRVIDWADANWGHPALDAARLMAYLGEDLRALVEELWTRAWLEHCPDSDPATALRLAIPLGHIFNATRYGEFMANVEESEQVYHTGDLEDEIRLAQAALV